MVAPCGLEPPSVALGRRLVTGPPEDRNRTCLCFTVMHHHRSGPVATLALALRALRIRVSVRPVRAAISGLSCCQGRPYPLDLPNSLKHLSFTGHAAASMMGLFPGRSVPASLPRSASAHLSVPSSSRVVGYVSAVHPVIRLPDSSSDLHSLLTAAFALGLTGLFPLGASSASVMR